MDFITAAIFLPFHTSHVLFKPFRGLYIVVVVDGWSPVCAYVHIHLIIGTAWMNESRIVEQFEWAQPERVQLQKKQVGQ